MGRMPWATYLWPGLPQIYREGRWSALAMAVGFAALVNLALMASLLWSELFVAGVRISVWMAVVAIWGVSALLSYRWGRRNSAPDDGIPSQDSFAQAVEHYLQGNWFESERLLRGLVGNNPRDLDAGLMLATLLRRTGRTGEARRQLDRIERFDGSESWALEISRERGLLGEARFENAPGHARGTDAAASRPPAGMADAA